MTMPLGIVPAQTLKLKYGCCQTNANSSQFIRLGNM
jgi:hypothetical protein